ncbi:MAG TPA: MarR family transcriptional regulator [Solirubrobacterales bacterium]|jgi:DNA-binding MarR family transcriptional regulator
MTLNDTAKEQLGSRERAEAQASPRGRLEAALIDATRANQVATEKMDEVVGRALGINRTDARCLDVIDRAGQLSAGQLAEQASITTGAVTAVVDRLESKGFVCRVPDPKDRRRVLLEMTELARKRSWELYGPLGERGRQHLERCSEDELRLLIEFMRLGTELNEARAAEIRAELEAEQAGG